MSFISSDETKPNTRKKSTSNQENKKEFIIRHKSSDSKRKSSLSSINSTTGNEDFEEPLKISQENRNMILHKFKIGIIKEGFHIFLKSNPFSRYNFIIDRHNEEFNKVINKI